MVYRIYVEKRAELAHEANALHSELKNLLGISTLASVRVLNRYDAENIAPDLFCEAVRSVFSEPQLDITTTELPQKEGEVVFAVEYLPGQFDQRADSAAQCIQIISQGERPIIRTAKVYLLGGDLSEAQLAIQRATRRRCGEGAHVLRRRAERDSEDLWASVFVKDHTGAHSQRHERISLVFFMSLGHSQHRISREM